MIDAAAIADILAIYTKHGWKLRRVLLSSELKASLTTSLQVLFGDTEIVSSPLDAAWFTRSSSAGSETWELRRLSITPFALLDVISGDLDAAAVSETLQKTEMKMLDLVSSKAKSK